MTDRPLNVSDAVALHTVLEAAQQTRKVMRLTADNNLIEGTARAIVTNESLSGFPGRDDDVRDCFLWVTTSAGWEAAWPVTALIAEVQTGEFGTEANA